MKKLVSLAPPTQMSRFEPPAGVARWATRRRTVARSPLPPVKFAAVSGTGHGSLRAAAGGAVLLLPRFPASGRAGGQDGLACRPGPAPSGADSPRQVKPTAPAGYAAARPDTASRAVAGGTAGLAARGLAALRPGRRARARHPSGLGQRTGSAVTYRRVS